MEDGIERRTFLKGAGSVLAGALSNTLPSLSDAAETFKYLESNLTPESLERYKTRSAEKLVGEVWADEPVREFALKNFFRDAQTPEMAQRKLVRSSTMAIPSAAELQELRKRSTHAEGVRNGSALDELALQIPKGKYGLYVDGATQKFYLLQNRGGSFEFVASFLTSTSSKEWSNKSDSGGTPLGMHHVAYHRTGKLGQILSKTAELEGNFPKLPVKTAGGTTQEYFARSLRRTNEPAVIITDGFGLWAPTTSLERGVLLHGTNHEDTLGVRYSGGCARGDNVSMRFLAGTDEQGVPFIEVGTLNRNGTGMRGGTPVMIHISAAEKRIPPATTSKSKWDANPTQPAQSKDNLPPGIKDVTGKAK